jgi:hypothetical protein
VISAPPPSGMFLANFRFRARRAAFLTVWLALVAGVGACKKESQPVAKPPVAAPEPAKATSAAPAATPPAAAAAVPEPVRKLLGQWMRADGGYTLDLRRADLSGAMEAKYFNPNPINVSRAIWMQGAAGLQVVVELTDVGYPGATYVLKHNADTDRLVGTYTQPQMQQTFEIEFVRQAKP